MYIAVGLVLLLSAGGRSIKGYRGSSGEVLFDGGSLGKFSLPGESRSYLVLVASITYYQLGEVYPGECGTTDRICSYTPDSYSQSHHHDSEPLAA